MATPQIHIRSISLPSRLHPTDFEVGLKTLKSCVVLPISSEAIQSGLVGLVELYNSVQELTKSPANQQSFAEDANSMEESLSGSVELLDYCSTISEPFQMIKDNVQTLQSALRRKGPDSSCIQNDINAYFCFRKKMSKCTAKTLKTIKNLENKNIGSSNLSVINYADENFTSMLRQVTGVTIAVFKSILEFLSLPVGRRPKGWSFVSKLMLTKSAASGRENDVINEIGNVDFALNSLQGKMRSNAATVLEAQMVQKRLQELEAVMEGFEGGLERLNRQLIQSRVALLNILLIKIENYNCPNFVPNI